MSKKTVAGAVQETAEKIARLRNATVTDKPSSIGQAIMTLGEEIAAYGKSVGAVGQSASNKKATIRDQVQDAGNVLVHVLRQINATGGSPTPGPAPNPQAYESAKAGKEQLLLLYSVSKGVIPKDHMPLGRVSFKLDGDLFAIDGTHVGRFEAVNQARFLADYDLHDYPNPPVSFDGPGLPKEDEWNPSTNPIKSKWTINGDDLVAVGRGLSRSVGITQGGIHAYSSEASFITGGTGQFVNSTGQSTTLGSFYQTTPPPADPFAFTFQFHAFHTIKWIRQGDHSKA